MTETLSPTTRTLSTGMKLAVVFALALLVLIAASALLLARNSNSADGKARANERVACAQANIVSPTTRRC